MIAFMRLSTACKLHEALPQLLPAAARSMSGSAVVDQMLNYVWKDLQGQGQAAIDVLRSGLQMQPDANKGLDSARLNLALAEAFAAEQNWAEAAACSQVAAAAADSTAAAEAVAGLAKFQASRALLVAARDTEATHTSSSSSSSRNAMKQATAVDLARQLLVQHACTTLQPEAASAAVQQLQQALQQQQQQQASSGTAAGVLLAMSYKVAGDAALALGDLVAASSSFDAAKHALSTISSSSVDGSSSSSSTTSAVSFASDISSCLSSQFQQEVAADVALGAAQVLIAHKDWEGSEASLSAALAAAEAAGGEKSPMLVPVLLLLAYGYARSARIMFAEGMLREAAKLLGGTEPDKLMGKGGSGSSSSRQLAHPSLKAALCWRYSQLLTALPNRTAEAAAWGTAAQSLWEKAGAGISGAGGLAEVLGDDVALTGKGKHGHGRGAVVSLFLRRLLPVLHSAQ